MINQKTIDNSQITNVILFRRGAVITRKAKIELEAGNTKLILPFLPSSVNANSINLLFSGNVKVNSVKLATNYLNSQIETPEIKKLKLKHSELLAKFNKLNSDTKVIIDEENYLKNSAPKELKITEFKELVAFFSERMSVLSLEKLKLEIEIKDLKIEIENVQNELKKYNDENIRSSCEIVCEVSSIKKVNEEVTYTYNIDNAGFTPSYDIRTSADSSCAEVTLKANVFQQSCENWENINLTISTSTPNISTSKPILNTWFLGFYNPVPLRATMMRKSVAPLSMTDFSAPNEMECESSFAASEYDYASITNGQAGVDFEIKDKVSIASGEEKFIEISKNSLPCDFVHYAINKIDKNVYLIAKLSNWEELSLISGDASVYLDNKFVGQTTLDRDNINKTLDVSLGIDDGIIIRRELITDLKGKTIFGSSVKAQRSFSLNIKNLKKLPIELELCDQIPVSTDKSIVIEPIELSGAELNKNKGELKWSISLPASKELTKTVKYSVTYPADKQVILD